MENMSLLCLPVIGAGIGWFTNYLAVKMLFRPRKPVRVLGLTFQGLVPKRQPEIAERIGEIVEAEFAIHERVSAILSDEESMAAFRRLLSEKVDGFVAAQKGALGGLVGALVGDDRLQQIKQSVVDTVMENIPKAVDEASHRIEERLRIRQTVSERIASFDLDKLEEIAQRVAHKELKHIELLGGVLGFLIGVAQTAVIWTLP